MELVSKLVRGQVCNFSALFAQSTQNGRINIRSPFARPPARLLACFVSETIQWI
jgi:hypothetical protein